MNKVNLVGRITKDIEIRTTEKGKQIISFTVAVKRSTKKENGEYETDFITCKAFEKRAEIISEHFKKGSKIGITGRIQTGSYEKDGKKIYTTDVIVEEIDFIEKKENDPFKEMGEKVEDDSLDELPF